MPQTYNKAWYDKNKEKMKAYRKEYAKKNPDKIKAQRERDYAKHKKRMETDPEYREKTNARYAKYHQEHPEVSKKACAKYRSKIKSMNPEELEAYRASKREEARLRYSKDPETFRKRNKEYRDKHKDEINARRRKKYAEDPLYNRSWKSKKKSIDILEKPC